MVVWLRPGFPAISPLTAPSLGPASLPVTPELGLGAPPAPSAAPRYFQSAGGLPAPDPSLVSWLTAVLAGGCPRPELNPLAMVLASLLPPDTLQRLAEEAIRQGRAPVDPRASRPQQVQQALAQDWKPARGMTKDGVVGMSQGDYSSQLGTGDRTIRSSGCFLTSLTMAATKISGDTSLDPVKANDRVLANGGFSGSNLVVPKAAEALGMRVTERAAVTPGNAGSLAQKLDQSLAAGRPAVAGVDYKSGSSSGCSAADHFITITGKNDDGSYRAIDPAGGKEIRLVAGPDGVLRSPDGSRTISEMTFLDRA